MVGIPSVLDRFPTAWMEIQPMGLVGPDVAVGGQDDADGDGVGGGGGGDMGGSQSGWLEDI